MSQETLWEKTVAELKQGILAADHPEGTRFPSLTELSQDYGISKITALRVVSELEQVGLVKRIPRRGTFIVGQHQSRAIKVLLNFRFGWTANAFAILWGYIRGIEESCRKTNYNMQLVSLEHVSASQSSGDRYILLATAPDSPGYQEFFEKPRPHVFLHSPTQMPQHDCIRADHRYGGWLMTRAMIDAGHKRIAYVGGAPGSDWHAPRIRGYLDALEECGLRPDGNLIREVTYSIPRSEDIPPQLEQLFSLRARPTAIVVSDDLRALLIIDWLKSKGLSVPGDIYVSGMDARVEASERELPLSTCDWQLEKQGQMAVDFLLYPRKTSGDEPREVVIKPKFVKGKTIRNLS